MFSLISAPDSKETTPTLTPMKDVIVSEGSPAQFRTKITGTPQPTIQWLREGLLIPQSADFQVKNDQIENKLTFSVLWTCMK